MEQGTRIRLLDAAEMLFAERGIDATSVRHVTAAAKANVSAVSFHFGGKEGLVRGVFLRRVRPLMERRLSNLASLKESDAAPTVEDLLDAFLSPLFEMAREADPGMRSFLRLFARTLIEPTPFVEDVFADELGPQTQAYFEAFAEILTDLPKSELAN